MTILKLKIFPLIAVTIVALSPWSQSTRAANVSLVRVPDGGIQPQAVTDDKGTVHVVYLKGDPHAADVYYIRQRPGQAEFSKPMRVNSKPGAAVAIGTIRGAELAIGKNGRAHVAWNGSPVGAPKGDNGMALTTMDYARLNDAGTAFEPQINVKLRTEALDGGGAVAADKAGNVFVAWHGRLPDAVAGEAGRAVYVARSTDEGRSFAREEQANPQATGACGCCGMKVFAANDGSLFALYRTATAMVNRDMTLLISHDGGRTFSSSTLGKWKVGTCPMSSESFAQNGANILAAWETDSRVYFSAIDPKSGQASPPVAPPGTGRRKYPALAVNAKGEILMAWAEGTGWEKGGSLAWQVFDTNGTPQGEIGRAPGVPVWGLPAAWARPDGSFVVMY